MMISRKVRLKPTPEQEALFWLSAGVARWTYNWTLSRHYENRETGGKFLSDSDLRKEITILKKEEDFIWIGDVSNDVAKQAVKDACDAYKRFFKGTTRFPRYKSKKRTTPSFFNDSFKIKIYPNKQVLLARIGRVKTSEQIDPKTKYYNPRIKFDGKYWYLTLSFEEPLRETHLTKEVIGVDLGIKELAVCSNGLSYANINKTLRVKKLEKRLRRLQRRISRKYQKNKGGIPFVKTCNIIKLEKNARHLHRQLSNIRLNHLHQVTTELVKTKPAKVVMEDLNVRGMMKNKHLAKQISRQNFSKFLITMEYKCQRYGIEFEKVPRFFPSSKTCSNCGYIKKELKLDDRVYKCECGLEIDRDLNAAINLASYGS